jgi:hypothetical protein
MLSQLGVGTSTATASLYLLVLGCGLGMTMQVLILAVQNAVPYAVLGAATSGVTLMRGVGGSVGTAVFGSIFTHRLTEELSGARLPAALRAIVGGGGRLTGEQVARLPAAARTAYEQAYVDALSPVFRVAAAVALLGFVVSWLLPERPLRATAATSTGLDDSLAAPEAPSSLEVVERALARATALEDRQRFHRAVAERAGLEVSTGATWALVRIAQYGFGGAVAAARRQGITEERIAEVVDELRGCDLLAEDALTPAGVAMADQLVAARRELLCDLLADPEAERAPEVQELLGRLSRELVGERP